MALREKLIRRMRRLVGRGPEPVVEEPSDPDALRVVALSDVCEHPVPLDPGPIVERVPAELEHAPSQVREAFREEMLVPPPVVESASGLVRDVTVLGRGVAIVGDQMIDETMNCVRRVSAYGGLLKGDDGVWRRTPDVRPRVDVPPVPGRTRVSIQSVWDTNYGHWLTDSLAKLHTLRGLDLPGKPLIVVNEQVTDAMRTVVTDTLELAGFGEGDVEWAGHNRHYEEIFIPATVASHPFWKTSAAVYYVAGLARDVEPGPHERIYLTRAGQARRRITDEDVLLAALEERGFVTVVPEQLTVREQMAAFKGARVVAGNLGAAFTNLLFSEPGIRVLALTSPHMQHDFFYDIVCHKRGHYRAVHGEPVGDGTDLSADYRLPADRVLPALERLLAE